MTREFKLPLAILDDPAFSPDPRSHPHFPLANARSYKALPPKYPSSPSDSESTSSTVSSSPVTSRSQSPTSPASLHSPVTLGSPLSTKPKPPPPHRLPPLLVPEILPTSDRASVILKPVQINIPRRARMKAFVRRLTTRHHLDRIDELDETDPFGGSYHHDGPYEAIGTTITQPTLPRVHGITVPRRGNVHHSKRESDPHPVRPSQYRSTYGGLSAHNEAGLSLHLEPGQILQQNSSIYTSCVSTIVGQFLPQSSTVPILTRPSPSRPQSLPDPLALPRQGLSSLDLRDDFQDRQPSSLRAPPEHYAGDPAPDISSRPPLHHGHPPYIHHQTERTVLPPPRHESRFHTTGPPRSSQRTPPPFFNPTSPTTQSAEHTGPALPKRDSRHKSIHSLDSSRTIDRMFAPSSFGTQHKPLEPPRVRHLPKRLVMPALLQPQPSHPQNRFSPADPPAWQDGYPDDHILEDAHFEGRPAMYSQEPRLLRKKSSAFPAKTPIPDHVPMPQDDTAPITRNSPTKSASETDGTKERTRRRRLSKRKNDI